MSCFWSLHEHYQNILVGKNWIIIIKKKNEGATIKIVVNESTTNVNEQLKILNDLCIKHGIKNYGFNNFIVKEILLIKKNYDSIYLFSSSHLKKMKNIHPEQIYDYMNNIVSFGKA